MISVAVFGHFDYPVLMERVGTVYFPVQRNLNFVAAGAGGKRKYGQGNTYGQNNNQ